MERKSNIFIMDEATAYIDHNTEKKIEELEKEKELQADNQNSSIS